MCGDLLSDVHLLPIFPWTSDDGFAVVDHRVVNPALGTWDDVERPRGGAWRDARLRRQPHLQPQPVVPGLARRRPVPRRLLRRARPRLRHVAGGAAANHPALPPLPAGRTAGETEAWTTFGPDQVDVDVRDPRTLEELTRRAARVRREGRVRGTAGRDRLPVEGVGHHLPAPAPDPRGDQDVARAGRARGAGHAVADGDQRAACREHLLLRQTGTTRPTSSTSSRSRPSCCTPSWPPPPTRLSDVGSHRRAGQRHGDLVQLPGQPRRHRAAGNRGHPRRRRARRARAAHPLARRTRLVGDPVRRAAVGLRAQPQLPRRVVHARGGSQPGRPRGQDPGRAQHPVHGSRRARGLPALPGGLTPRPRGHGDQPHQPADQPRRPRRRPARRRAAGRPAPPRGADGARATCSTCAAGTRPSRRSAPNGSSASTTGSSPCVGGRGPPASCSASPT